MGTHWEQQQQKSNNPFPKEKGFELLDALATI
jgi:hypothetical protein